QAPSTIRRVLPPFEAHRAEDGPEFVLRDLVAYRLAVEPGLRHRLLQDLEPGPAMAAGPAVGLLAEPLLVRIEVGLGFRAGPGVPGSHADHAFGIAAHHVLVELEGGA